MRKLRVRFILAAMISMFIVLGAIMTGMNVWNYLNITQAADREIDMIVDNDGVFPGRNDMPANGIPAPPDASMKPDEDLEKTDYLPPDASAKPGEEMPDEASRPAPPDASSRPEPPDASMKPGEPPDNMNPAPGDFSAEAPYEIRYFTVYIEGETITGSHMDNIASVTEEEAKKYAADLIGNGDERGIYNGQYRYRVTDSMVVFVDCEKRLDSYIDSFWTSVLVSIAGLLVVFFLIVLTSKRVFKPVEESERKQKQFLTDASHELKTPLAIIEANTEVMELENGESKWTASTRHQVERLSGLVQQMITLTRLDETDEDGQPEPVLLSEVVRNVTESFFAPAEVANKSIELSVEDDIRIRANEKNIRQLIGILLDNAVKYATDNTTIKVNLSKSGKRASLSVYNRAASITKGDNRILFERFYRNDASRNSKTGGSGIGLSIAQSIVEKSGGQITAHSDDGESLTITATFPRVHA